jgi:quercetin dioxygenase-like cupin family protein
MSIFYHQLLSGYVQICLTKPDNMNRKKFLLQSLLAAPALAFANSVDAEKESGSAKKPFIVDANKSRYGDNIKFLGVHPNDLKISGKDTGGQLSVFEYTGLGKVGPMLHVHFKQDEIFTVTEGSYRFVVGEETHVLQQGQTIFLPRGIPHTWIQLSEKGKMIYFLQPAGKMEEFFVYMNNLKERPSPEELDRIHAKHQMKVVGPPLTL